MRLKKRMFYACCTFSCVGNKRFMNIHCNNLCVVSAIITVNQLLCMGIEHYNACPYGAMCLYCTLLCMSILSRIENIEELMKCNKKYVFSDAHIIFVQPQGQSKFQYPNFIFVMRSREEEWILYEDQANFRLVDRVDCDNAVGYSNGLIRD